MLGSGLAPRLDRGTLQPLADRIVAVTLPVVFMVGVGVGFRTGGLT